MTSSDTGLAGTDSDIEYLLSTRAIRDRAGAVLQLALNGGTGFTLHLDRLDSAVERVLKLTRERFPDFDTPFHSRWRHFEVGQKLNLPGILAERLESLPPDERVRARIDLAVTSVLLDAGAGEAWTYTDSRTGERFDRSEGLAVASFHMFMDGAFSSDPDRPLRADAAGLARLTREQLAVGFQVSERNPLAGFEGRLSILNSLGAALHAHPGYFGSEDPRPGELLGFLRSRAAANRLKATEILTAIQRGFGSIWPGRVSVNGFNLGDVWPYPSLGEGLAGLVPFHKLSQWLSYSLIEPLRDAGLEITDADELTGLAEYRNGGLFLDSGVIELRNPSDALNRHRPGSPLIVEWRALTIALLDRLAARVREATGRPAEELPLGKILEGGTWLAGRRIARELRPDGAPPLQLESDGTVF